MDSGPGAQKIRALAQGRTTLARPALRISLICSGSVNAPGPGSATGQLQRGQRRVCRRGGQGAATIFSRCATRQKLRAFSGVKRRSHAPTRSTRASVTVSINPDADDVAITDLADRAARQPFRADMPAARAGGESRKPRVRPASATFFPTQMFQLARDLIRFLHARCPPDRCRQPSTSPAWMRPA